MWRQILLFVLIAIAAPVSAQDRSSFTFGGDQFLAGRNVVQSAPVTGDLFIAGSRVSVNGEVDGTAHMMGRSVSLNDRVAGNVYAAGMNVEINGPVSGNVSASGNSVTISEPVTGNLRAAAGDVTLAAPVAGSAMLGGETVIVDGAISGDLAISGEALEWGDNARVDGMLHVYGDDPDEYEIPASVAPSERIQFHEMDDWEHEMPDGMMDEAPGFWAMLGGFLGGVFLTGLVATIVAALAPNWVTSLREGALAKPARSLWIGAVGLATAIGATVVVAITGIGIFVAPFTIFAAVLLGFAGYVTGAYLLGVWAVGALGRGMPDDTVDRAIAAFAGALILALVALIPFLGWLAVYAVALIGIGGLVIKLFRPGFYVEG